MKAYRTVEYIPSESADDASGSDDEWLQEKQKDGSGLVTARSNDGRSEDADVAEDAPPDIVILFKAMEKCWN